MWLVVVVSAEAEPRLTVNSPDTTSTRAVTMRRGVQIPRSADAFTAGVPFMAIELRGSP